MAKTSYNVDKIYNRSRLIGSERHVHNSATIRDAEITRALTKGHQKDNAQIDLNSFVEQLEDNPEIVSNIRQSFKSKKLDFNSASQSLLKCKTERWLKKHDGNTRMAILGKTHGKFFGIMKQEKKKIMVGEIIPMATKTKISNTGSSLNMS